MTLSDRQLLDSLSRMPFVDSAELAGVLGEPHATVHRALTGLLADGIVGRVSHGTALLPSSQRYYLTAKPMGQCGPVNMCQRPRPGSGIKCTVQSCDLYTPTGLSPFAKCSLISVL